MPQNLGYALANSTAISCRISGVWTCGAYVARRSAQSRVELISDVATQFRAGKHRYQDKFRGGHLRAKKSDYREHCRGDPCPNFAPPDLIQIRLDCQLDAGASAVSCEPRTGLAGVPQRAQDCPIVSCIMPICNRRAFLPAALACFAAQNYSHLELIVVDDGSDSIADLLPTDPRIRYFRLDGKLNTGAKRNFACEQARGACIAHWDGDWYAPNRIRRQLEAMRGTHWQVSGTTTMYYLRGERN